MRHGIRHAAARAERGLRPCTANGRLRHMLIGYASVSKADGSQPLDQQRDARRATCVPASSAPASRQPRGSCQSRRSGPPPRTCPIQQYHRRGDVGPRPQSCARAGGTASPHSTPRKRFGNCRPSLLAVLDVLLNPAQACANKAARASPASVGMGRRTSQAPRVRCRRRRAMAGTPRPLDRAEMEPTALIAF